jgi:hypothetical protein
MKYLVLTLVFTFSLLVSCNKQDQAGTFNIGEEAVFQHGEMNQSNINYLEFTITEINDSRCPSDVQCVWAGKVDVNIMVEKPYAGTVELSSHNHSIDTLGDFSFELIDVAPYPLSTETIELKDYQVTLDIHRINRND